MSPALKGGVPVGSAEMKTVPPPEPSQNAQQRLNDTSNIVRLQAFEKCSDKLLTASKRLEIEAQYQSKYWDQMAEIRSNGWPVSRLPRDGRTLVAHVASTEASPHYRSKGLVPFRRDENGDLTIPNVQGEARQRRLAVSVRRGSKVTGYYQGHQDSTGSESSLQNALVRAKERIFEEELFSEASREAQLIASMGAKVRSTSIEIEISPECAISITYGPSSSDRTASSLDDDGLAAFVGKSLRMMLIAEHEARYRTRSQRTPAPMISNPRPSSEYVLIRPIVAQLRHHFDSFSTLQDLQAYQTALQLAGLRFSIDIRNGNNDNPLVSALQGLRQVTSSLVKITLPSNISIELSIETQLASPRFGTQYSSTEYKSSFGSRGLQPTSSPHAAASFVTDVISRDICHTILTSNLNGARWKVQTLHPLELVLIKDSKPRALLVTSCHSGTVAVSCLQVDTGTTEKVIYSKTESTLIAKGGESKETREPFNAVLAGWVARALG